MKKTQKMLRINTVVNVITRLWWIWLIIAMITTFAVIMLLSLGQSVWFDEGYSIMITQRPISELLALTAVDAHPPLYYLLLKAWASVFGWGEFALRSFSAVLASLTVGVVFLLIRKLFTVRVALVALPLLVLAPFALRYGYEIRMYALAALIGALATLVLVYAYKKESTKLWVLYAILVALGMYTLYMSAALWLAHVVWLLAFSKREHVAFFKQKWVFAYVGAVALFALYIPTFFHQLFNSALPGIGGAITLTKLGNIASMTISFTPEWKVSGVLALGLLIVIGLTIYLLASVRRSLPESNRSSLWLLIALVLVPLAFFALSSLPKPIFVDRYIAHIVIYSYALIGVAVALAWRYGRRISAAILFGLSFVLLASGVAQLYITGNFVFERMQYPRTAETRSIINCDDQTTVIADDPYTYIDSRYYFSDCHLKFFSEKAIEKKGGYGPLYDSTARITTSQAVISPVLIHLRWDGATPSFVVDDRYQLIETTVYDKQAVDRYELGEE